VVVSWPYSIAGCISVVLIVQSVLDWFDELSIGSADEGAEWSEVDEDEVPEPTLAGKQACLYALWTLQNGSSQMVVIMPGTLSHL